MPREFPLDEIADFLTGLDWADRCRSHERVANHWRGLEPAEVLTELHRILPAAIDVDRSVEKTTHYKWFVSGAVDQGFELWLHEYKPAALRRTGHATVPHNHRFWLTSLMLRGGFTDTRYARTEAASALVEPVSNRSMEPGETIVINPEEIHSLSELQDGTVSMVVQSRPIRSYSEVFENGEVRRYSDLEAKLAEFRESL